MCARAENQKQNSKGSNNMTTKKDYVAVANAIHTATADAISKENIAFALIAYFEQDNPRFDRARFLLACGL